MFKEEEILPSTRMRMMLLKFQGFGNAGSWAAMMLEELGEKVVAVSDSKGGIQNTLGLNAKKLETFKEKTGSVTSIAMAEEITNEDPLELDVDILIPASFENQLTASNADQGEDNIRSSKWADDS